MRTGESRRSGPKGQRAKKQCAAPKWIIMIFSPTARHQEGGELCRPVFFSLSVLMPMGGSRRELDANSQRKAKCTGRKEIVKGKKNNRRRRAIRNVIRRPESQSL